MDFGFEGALAILKTQIGAKVARRGWNGAGMHIAIQHPDEHSQNRQSYLYIVPVGGQRVPWVASQPDLLENDWYEVTS